MVCHHTNNLTLNRSKSVDIVFTNSRRRSQSQLPKPIDGITRVSSIKILGVTISCKLSMSDHVSNVIGGCSQILYALRVLRAYGMCDTALNDVYQAVVIAKLTYAVCAWWGFTNSTDRQRIESFVRKGVRSGFCRSDFSTFEHLVDDLDKSFFRRVLKDKRHVLHPLLPDQRHVT